MGRSELESEQTQDTFLFLPYEPKKPGNWTVFGENGAYGVMGVFSSYSLFSWDLHSKLWIIMRSFPRATVCFWFCYGSLTICWPEILASLLYDFPAPRSPVQESKSPLLEQAVCSHHPLQSSPVFVSIFLSGMCPASSVDRAWDSYLLVWEGGKSEEGWV